jgi:hypothetical protein
MVDLARIEQHYRTECLPIPAPLTFDKVQKSRTVDNRRNYYRIMHVQPDAPTEIIKSSYRTLMQRLKQHPDLGGEHAAAALINEAYRVLMDPVSRKQYDRERDLIKRSSPDQPAKGKAGKKADAAETADDVTVGTDAASDSIMLCLFCLMPQLFNNLNDPEAVCVNCTSPLRPASDWQLETIGQRAINRIPKNLDINFYTAWPQSTAYTGHTLDVSPNGLRFISDHRLEKGQYIKISSNSLDAIALITYCQQDDETHRWIVGVSFQTLRFRRSQGAFFSAKA